ncbi:MAG: LacI family DNA-binding transcriptional regulator [Capsulimonadaceae bacterium]|nr:LacI family DNA-binding transcriptional regulator [Capsulimonadaceae bacterium]
MAVDTGVEVEKRKKRKPNVFDVARVAGVSQTTVSFVLNGSTTPRISDATTKRVLAAVEQLGYRRNTLARSLAHGKTMTVGMVLSSLDDDFHGVILRTCQERLDEQGYQLLYVQAASGSAREALMVQFLLEHRVDAVICFAHEYSTYIVPEWLSGMRDEGVPGVMIDSTRFASMIDSVGSDDIDGMYKAMKHLYDLGHRRIALVSDNWQPDLVPDRISGYDLAIERLGIDYNVQVGSDRRMNDIEKSAEMARLLDGPEPPTAFVTYNDYTFEYFLMNYAGTRFRVPEDVSLVGYGNLYLSRFAKLTSVGQRPEEIGRVAAECVLARLKNPDRPLRKVEIETELVVRSSTAPPRPVS